MNLRALFFFALVLALGIPPWATASKPRHTTPLPKVVRDAIPQAKGCSSWKKARYGQGFLYVIYDLNLEVPTSDGVGYRTSYPFSCYYSASGTLTPIDPSADEHRALPVAFEQVCLPQPLIFGRKRSQISAADLPPAAQMGDTYPAFSPHNWRDWIELGRLYAEGNSETEAFNAFQQAYMQAPRNYAKWGKDDYRRNLPWGHLEAAATWYRLCRPDLGNCYLWQFDRYIGEMLAFETGFARYLSTLIPSASRLPPLKTEDCLEQPIPSGGHDTLLANPQLKYIAKISADSIASGHVRLYQPNGDGILECGDLIRLKDIQSLRMVWNSWDKIPEVIQLDVQTCGATMDTPLWRLEKDRYLLYPLPPNPSGACALFLSIPPMPYLALPLIDLRALWGLKEYNR